VNTPMFGERLPPAGSPPPSEQSGPTDATVYVVDDDLRIRRSMQRLFEAAGLRACTYATIGAFLEGFDPGVPGCLVLDLRLRGESGFDLQDELRRRGATIPVIFVTGHASVPGSVRAMRGGALDFMEKPIQPRQLLARVTEALERDGHHRRTVSTRTVIERRLARLTRREREVARHLMKGATSKEIATVLGMSVRTVEGHRREVLRKMEVGSAAGLVRLVAEADPKLLGE
jgi:FixJ family two-component response regulator